jgi:lysozyme family protein
MRFFARSVVSPAHFQDVPLHRNIIAAPSTQGFVTDALLSSLLHPWLLGSQGSKISCLYDIALGVGILTCAVLAGARSDVLCLIAS